TVQRVGGGNAPHRPGAGTVGAGRALAAGAHRGSRQALAAGLGGGLGPRSEPQADPPAGFAERLPLLRRAADRRAPRRPHPAPPGKGLLGRAAAVLRAGWRAWAW